MADEDPERMSEGAGQTFGQNGPRRDDPRARLHDDYMKLAEWQRADLRGRQEFEHKINVAFWAGIGLVTWFLASLDCSRVILDRRCVLKLFYALIGLAYFSFQLIVYLGNRINRTGEEGNVKKALELVHESYEGRKGLGPIWHATYVFFTSILLVASYMLIGMTWESCSRCGTRASRDRTERCCCCLQESRGDEAPTVGPKPDTIASEKR